MSSLTLSTAGVQQPIKSETFTVQTYRLLRTAILTHELKTGEVYSQDQISEMLNISRTPVREALLALQKDGYIKFLRGRGFEVITLNQKELEDMLEVRMIIERAAAGMAAERISDAQMDRLKEIISAQNEFIHSASTNITEYLELDEAFHRQIWEASNNGWISRTTGDLRNQLIRNGFSILKSNEAAVTETIFDEHRLVWLAVQAHDAAGAERAMAAHIANTRKRNLALD